MYKFVGPIFLFISLVCGQLFANPSAAETSSIENPEVVTTKFYKWYLRSIAQNHDPLTDDKAGLAAYVSTTLIHEIESKQNSAEGLDQDYFIQAQDYLDDWESNVSAKSQPINGATDEVVVTLGASKDSTYLLGVTLIQENKTWKIRKIHPLKHPN